MCVATGRSNFTQFVVADGVRQHSRVIYRYSVSFNLVFLCHFRRADLVDLSCGEKPLYADDVYAKERAYNEVVLASSPDPLPTFQCSRRKEGRPGRRIMI